MSQESRRNSARKNDVPTVKLSREESTKQLSFLLSFYKPYKYKALIALVILVVTASAGLLFPRLVGMILDSVLHPEKSGYSPGIIAGALLGVMLIQFGIRYVFSMQLATVTENVIATLRTRVFEHLIRLPMKFFGERRVGELSSRLSSDLTQIQETFSFAILELMRQTIFLVGGVAFIVSKSMNLAAPILLAMPVLIAIAVLFGRKIRTFSTKTQDALAQSATIVEETLQGISSVKSYSNESYEATRYNSALQTTIVLAIKTAKMRSAFISFILFAFFGGIAGVIWYGGTLVQQGEITIGDFATFLMYAMFVGGAMGSFAELFSQVQKSLGAAVRIQEILEEKTEEKGNGNATKLHSVSVLNIEFSYPSRPEIPTLKNVSLEIGAGKRVAFVGESGAGKSTMAALIQRFYEPDTGEILYDGMSSKTLSLADVRLNIGVVPQDIVLFGGSILENIRYGNLAASEEEVWQAAELANATEFISKFPEKLHTLVGERGVKLSGGQRQRIAIARAILRNPPILILDEATSSLDSESEHLIQEAVERLMASRTTIIIAHRLSTVRRCDTIFVFSKGEIIESGTHDELIANPESKYARLCALQFETEMRS
jgi:ABC-type multidrug transport system fused ATPase/permease subunit